MRRILAMMVLTIVSLTIVLPAPAAAHSHRCFVETGFCIGGVIREYWERNGGLAVFGYPISELRVETVEGSWTGMVQWFERDRLEDHTPEGKGVLAGRLGVTRFQQLYDTDWQQLPRDNTRTEGCRFFRETQFNLCEPFLSYWQNNGGLARFGYPITRQRGEQIEGREHTVQYFERRRMEYHPKNAGTPYAVLLGLLGKDLMEPVDGTPDYEAQRTVTEFFNLLDRARYAQAAALYAGSYDALRQWNPTIKGNPVGNPQIQAQLWERGCNANGLVCLPVRNVVRVEGIGAAEWRVTVEFSNLDGSLFRHPQNTKRTQFSFTVQRIHGQYRMVDMPLYIS